MRKTGIAFCAAAALLFLVNASIWEGAASAAAKGDLPESGYFAATNSFPRNTVVEITNLENGSTIRVIVAQGLDTPGLLVVLSKEAADAINLPTRSIGRVRMSQPTDPVAYSRYTEGLASSGDPDHNPEALIAAEGGINPDLFDETVPEKIEKTPESGGAPLIAAADDAYTAPPAASPDTGIIYEPDPALVWMYPEDPAPAEELEHSVWTETPGPVIAAPIAELNERTSPQEVPASTVNPEAYDFIITPAEERIPPETSIINPADMVAQIGPTTHDPERGYTIDPYYVIDPVETPAGPKSNRPAEPAPAYTPYTPSSIPGESFSVPVIASLEKGKYYLQLAALSKPETVESEINKIGRAWPMAVQSAGSADKPVYRILIGPVNLGESGALLRRFKTNYKDAFVRMGS